MERTHAASAKRLQATKASGLIAHSWVLTWAGAMVGAAIASWQLLPTLHAMVVSGVGQAANLAAVHATDHTVATAANGALLAGLATVGQQRLGELLSLGGIIVCAAAIGALLMHLMMVRSGWQPRRTVPNAAVMPLDMGRRAVACAGWTIAAAASLLVLVAWVWRSAPVLAASLQMASTSTVLTVCSRALVITLVTILLAIGTLHLLWRSWQIYAAQRMTKPEVEREQHEAAVSPAIRQALRRIAGQATYVPTLVCYDQEHAVAIAWHAATMTSPVLVWHRRDAAARLAVHTAQRTGTAVCRDLQLTHVLRSVAPGTVIPSAHWPALASAVAAQT